MKTLNKMRLLVLFSSLPLLGFIFLGVVLYQRVFAGDPQLLPSALIGKPVPEFALPPLAKNGRGLNSKDLQQGKITLLNVWASWCIPCRAEHPYLMQLQKQGFMIASINYKDKPEAALKFLADNGNPYTATGMDESGRTGIDFGVYGVPESFIVDGSGKIIFKHVGPLNATSLKDDILPRLQGKKS